MRSVTSIIFFLALIAPVLLFAQSVDNYLENRERWFDIIDERTEARKSSVDNFLVDYGGLFPFGADMMVQDVSHGAASFLGGVEKFFGRPLKYTSQAYSAWESDTKIKMQNANQNYGYVKGAIYSIPNRMLGLVALDGIAPAFSGYDPEAPPGYTELNLQQRGERATISLLSAGTMYLGGSLLSPRGYKPAPPLQIIHNTSKKNLTKILTPDPNYGVHLRPALTEPFIYGGTSSVKNRLAAAFKYQTLNATGEARIIFQGSAAKVFQPHPYGGLSFLRKRFLSNEYIAKGRILIPEGGYTVVGNQAYVTQAQVLPFTGRELLKKRLGYAFHGYGTEALVLGAVMPMLYYDFRNDHEEDMEQANREDTLLIPRIPY